MMVFLVLKLVFPVQWLIKHDYGSAWFNFSEQYLMFFNLIALIN